MSFGHYEERRSKKDRPCDWCIERIQPGDSYQHYWGDNGDGDVVAVNVHGECGDAIDREADGDYESVDWATSHHRGKTTEETEEARRQ